MCDSRREHRPLLYEDLTDDEQFSEYPRGFRPTSSRGRAKYNVRGAAAIITLWPDHWTTSVRHWWTVLGMLAITFFIVYNFFVAYALLPSFHLKSLKPRVSPNVAPDDIAFESHTLPNVYMHTFVKPNEEAELHLPQIEKLTNDYPDFKYRLIVVLNDTLDLDSAISAEENNELAFNTLWTKKVIGKEKIKHNVNVEYVSLSKYLNESPLKKYWKTLPQEFYPFLVRAISIWDKGGVAFNPYILTSETPHLIYAEKLNTILKNYNKQPNAKSYNTKMVKKIEKSTSKTKKSMNNIRDIIEALENDSLSNNSVQDSLSEAENKILTTRSGRKLHSVVSGDDKFESKLNPTLQENTPDSENVIESDRIQIMNTNSNDMPSNAVSRDYSTKISESNNDNSLNLLPMFIEYLFHDKTKHNINHGNSSASSKKNNSRQQRRIVIPVNKTKENTQYEGSSLNEMESNNQEKYRPMIIAAKGLIDSDIETDKIKDENDSVNNSEHASELTIDLNGNIIATMTPCHAFIGTIFSNVRSTEKESLKDFIITELSIFCKGLLSSCRGIDVILL